MTEKVYRSENACVTIQSDKLQEAYQNLSAWRQITYGVMGLETCPTTGKLHLQSYFEFRNTMRCPTFWNKVGLPGSYFTKRTHSQIQAINYCKKDNNFVEWGIPAAHEQGKRYDLLDVIDDIKAGMSEREISLTYVTTYASSLKWVQRMMELHSPSVTPSRFTLLDCCMNLKTQPINFSDPNWEHYAIVEGPPGCGKTQYALSHFENPLLVTHNDKLKSFDADIHDGIVFDDMDYTHWPVTSQIHLVNWHEPADIHCRYTCAHIPAHVKKIFTCNPQHRPLSPDVALEDRAYKVIISDSQAPRSRRVRLDHKNTWGPMDDIMAKF